MPTDDSHSVQSQRSSDGAVQKIKVTIPIEVTVSIGLPIHHVYDVTVKSIASNDEILEKIVIDPQYPKRKGYDPDFLAFTAPFPKVASENRKSAYDVPGQKGDEKYLLKYHHYSLIFNKDRKLAFVAGVNFDPMAKFKHQRDKGGDRWFYDPRVEPQDIQTGEIVYEANPLDRGHLVRRADSGWGATAQEAKLANDDTFHFTNCSPQHEITNQGITGRAAEGVALWGKLEDHVAAQGKSNQQKLCVFNGPVFKSNDRLYRGTKLPKSFWKVIVYERDNGKPGAAAFVLSQASFIKGLEEAFESGEFESAQIKMRDLESRTGLNFGPFRQWDSLEDDGVEESFTNEAPIIVLSSLNDLVL